MDNHKIGIYPRYLGHKHNPIEYIVMSLTFKRLVKFCKAFDIPVRFIRTDKSDTLGFYYAHLVTYTARKLDAHFLDGKPNFFGKTWKEY